MSQQASTVISSHASSFEAPVHYVPTESSSARRVVVVDDPGGRQLVQLMAGSEFVVDSAISLEEASAILDRDPAVELIALDAFVSGFRMLEFVTVLREKRPDVAVIIMSATPDVLEAQAALRAGAADYLLKPLRKAELLNSLERACLSARSVESKRASAYGLCRILALKDEETKGHCDRVVGYSQQLGKLMGLSQRQLFELEMGSLLHDVGKLRVANAILKKPDTLDAEEWIEMRKHPLIGEELLLMCGFPNPVARIAGQHHEQWDGGGYPKHLKGAEIDLLARVFAVADAVDAVTSDRVYRAGRGFDVARQEIRNGAGSQFDPMVGEAFLSIPDTVWQGIRVEAELRAWPLMSVADCL